MSDVVRGPNINYSTSSPDAAAFMNWIGAGFKDMPIAHYVTTTSPAPTPTPKPVTPYTPQVLPAPVYSAAPVDTAPIAPTPVPAMQPQAQIVSAPKLTDEFPWWLVLAVAGGLVLLRVS